MQPRSNMNDEKLARRRREDALGQDIIEECRVQLMLKFRFLDLALWRMDLEPLRVGAAYPLATDATRVAYDPERVIARFGESFEECIRDYLHLVMHCIFRHPFDEDHKNAEAWSLACDVVAEAAAMDMCAGRFPSEDDAERRQALSEIRMHAGSLAPGKVYTLMKALVQTPDGQQYRGMGRSTLNLWHSLFERDDHAAWPANNKASRDDSSEAVPEEVSEGDDAPDSEESAARVESAAFEEAPEDDAAESERRAPEEDAADKSRDDDEDASPEQADDAPDAEHGRGEEDDGSESDERTEREWEEIAKQIEMNLETFSKEWGDEAGSLMASLAVANRKRYDYGDFLRRFMAPSEEMLLNQDEFDYVYYTYGMEVYGNMPLVEPLEYKETDRVREFAIVIDTSESVSGPLVRRFLSHTFSVLKSSESYASDVNIHVIQCDARVQSDMKIRSLADVDELMERFTVRGFGGTDFRPAFDYVEGLRLRGEFTELKGLIYFTDGLGQFPEKAPDYDVAFVFMDDDAQELPPVPPWAMKLVVDEAGINKLKSRPVG